MKSMNRFALAVSLAGVALAGPAHAKVKVVQAPSAALAPGSTFAWAPIAGLARGTGDPAIANQITAQRLDLAVESALASKGYRQVRSPIQAQLLVSYQVVMNSGRELRVSGGGCAIRFCRAGSVDTSSYTEGTLVLDLVERSSGRLVYRATSQKRLSSKDASQEKLNQLLQGMTKSLPM